MLHFSTRENKWALCPRGKFLRGFRKSGGHTLAHIVEAKCCSPQTYFGKWGSCYDEDVTDTFHEVGWSTCKPGFYIVGLYKSACNELRCLERFRCCDMGEPGKYHYNRSAAFCKKLIISIYYNYHRFAQSYPCRYSTKLFSSNRSNALLLPLTL